MAMQYQDDFGDEGIAEHNYEEGEATNTNLEAVNKTAPTNENEKAAGKAISLEQVQKELDKAGIQYGKQVNATEEAFKAKWPEQGLGR